MTEPPKFGINLGPLKMANFVFEDPGLFNLKEKPVPQLEVIGLGLSRQRLPSVVHPLVEDRDLRVRKPF
jgi:hypothetical protein